MESYRSHTDEILFSFVQNRDERAFTELYDRYWKKLLVRAHLLLNSHEDAEEVVHDIFVNLWKKRATPLRIQNSFHTYIAAMLKYKCFEVLAKRRQKRSKIILGKELEEADNSTQQWLDFEYLQEELEKAVCLLPERCQLIFRLSREQMLTDKEVAERLDLSVNTVRTQMHRALQKLKTSLNSFFLL